MGGASPDSYYHFSLSSRTVGDVTAGDKGYGADVTDVIAHRGDHRVAGENTIAAFTAAKAAGADGVELDVRRTADGALVLHHDAALADGRVIVHCRRDELPAELAAFDAALDACRGLLVNIEIKNDPSDPDFDPDDGVAAAVLDILAGRPEPSDQWLISSFRRDTVDRCHQLAPHVPTAWLCFDTIDRTVLADLAATGHRAVHPYVGFVTSELIADAHAAGLRVNTWTCNDAAQATQLAEWGVDGIVTDNIATISAALG